MRPPLPQPPPPPLPLAQEVEEEEEEDEDGLFGSFHPDLPFKKSGDGRADQRTNRWTDKAGLNFVKGRFMALFHEQ